MERRFGGGKEKLEGEGLKEEEREGEGKEREIEKGIEGEGRGVQRRTRMTRPGKLKN